MMATASSGKRYEFSSLAHKLDKNTAKDIMVMLGTIHTFCGLYKKSDNKCN